MSQEQKKCDILERLRSVNIENGSEVLQCLWDADQHYMDITLVRNQLTMKYQQIASQYITNMDELRLFMNEHVGDAYYVDGGYKLPLVTSNNEECELFIYGNGSLKHTCDKLSVLQELCGGDDGMNDWRRQLLADIIHGRHHNIKLRRPVHCHFETVDVVVDADGDDYTSP